MENPDEQSHERERMKMRIAVLEESVRSSEVDCKASRETVLRLLGELDRERRKAASSAAALQSLKVELDGLTEAKTGVETENQTLTERLDAGRRVVEAARQESRCLERQVEELERKLHASQRETQEAEDKLRSFLSKVAALLQGQSDDVTPPKENDVLLKLDKTVSDMEDRLRRDAEQLREQTQVQHGALQRAQLAERQVQDLRERLQSLETELLTSDAQRDGLRHANQLYEELLEQLSEAMKVDSIAVDLGFDMRVKLILSRAEQLVKHEGSDLVESKTLAYNLQRKLKTQKDQLESKTLHVQLLRKKMSDLEEERRSRSALAAEREGAHQEVKRLQKKLERLQSELRATRLSNTELKAQLSHTSELKLKVMEQSETVQEQKKRLGRLVEGKAEAEKRLSTVSSELQSREEKGKEDERQVEALRRNLTQLAARERELVDFQMVVSRMLGVDAAAAAAASFPNHEIIRLLEILLHAHHHRHHLHHHHHHLSTCPTHHSPHLLHIHDLHDDSFSDAPASGSTSQ